MNRNWKWGAAAIVAGVMVAQSVAADPIRVYEPGSRGSDGVPRGGWASIEAGEVSQVDAVGSSRASAWSQRSGGRYDTLIARTSGRFDTMVSWGFGRFDTLIRRAWLGR